jgi:hypothetical protein
LTRRGAGSPDGQRGHHDGEQDVVDRRQSRLGDQQPGDQDARCRPGCSGSGWSIAAAEPGGQKRMEARQSYSSSSISDRMSAGVEITYFSDAQLPKSMIRQRSQQNGNSGFSRVTSFRQMGHLKVLICISSVRKRQIAQLNRHRAGIRLGITNDGAD